MLVETDANSSNARKSIQKVLDEDEYTDKMEKIIVRDFYPDLPKLREQHEYLDALQRNDTEKLRELQIKRASKARETPRDSRPATGVLPTPSSTFETPIEANKNKETASVPEIDELLRTYKNASKTAESSATPATDDVDANTDLPSTSKEKPFRNPEPKPAPKTRDDSKLSLDGFLSRNTSEDNQSFSDIMAESEKKLQIKHAWLYDKEKEQKTDLNERLSLPSIENQAIMDSSSSLDSWTYKAKNAVMYVPEGIEMTPEEKMQLKAKGGRAITHANTRFTSNPFATGENSKSIKDAANTQTSLLLGKVGVDGKEVLPRATPTVNGYGFVATPTPAPGVEDTPLMTWGEIEGTPLVLEGTPLRATPGPQFKIPDVPQRDRLHYELAEKASKAHRDKKTAAMQRVQRNMASPSPRFGSSKTTRLTGLSPAAQKLASGRLGIGAGSDRALSESYTPTPTRRRGTDKTPSLLTPSPSAKRNSTPGSKRPNTGGVTTLTDNLLVLSKRKK